MNEEEKEKIKHLIERCNECKLNACITCDICWSEVQAIDKLYNSNEKQQNRILELEKALIEEDYKHREEIETLKRDFEIVDHECNRLEQEDIKKDKIINLMAKDIKEADKFLDSMGHLGEYAGYTIEDIIEEYKKEAEYKIKEDK